MSRLIYKDPEYDSTGRPLLNPRDDDTQRMPMSPAPAPTCYCDPTESAFSKTYECFEFTLSRKTSDMAGFFASVEAEAVGMLSRQLAAKGSIKFWSSLEVLFRDRVTDEILPPAHSASNALIIVNANEIEDKLKETFEIALLHAEAYEGKGSGQVIDGINHWRVYVAQYAPMNGRTFVELPKSIKAKKACVNVKNKDNEWLRWALLSYKFPASKNPDRVSQYNRHYHALDFTGISFPVTLDDLPRVESQNKLAINVYELEDGTLRPIYFSKIANGMADVPLLLYQGHYIWIKYFDGLMFDQTGIDHHRSYCHKCLMRFADDAALTAHMPHCQNDDLTKIEMPCEPILKFRNHHKELLAPFVIYADFECFLKPMAPQDPRKATQRYQEHVPYSFGCVTVQSCCENQTKIGEPRIYRGDRPTYMFLDTVLAMVVEHHANMSQPMNLTNDEQRRHNLETTCVQCKLPLGNDRARDHCHICGKYRAALHRSCNLRWRLSRDAIVVFHNLWRYDGHLIMQELGKICSEYNLTLDCIARGAEDYVTFNLKSKEGWKIQFIDSFQFLTSSLASLVSLLPRAEFHAMRKFIQPEHVDLLLRKGVFPYSYVDGWDKLDEPELPPQAEFYNDLNDEALSDQGYEHALRVKRDLNLGTLGEYSDLYLKTDVLLLADVFENFRRFGSETYGLDPCAYFTLPSYAYDACLKYTAVEIELLTCPTMYTFLEGAIRGGTSMITKRWAEANNPLIKGHDPTKPENYILYLDCNNLYGSGMQDLLPIGGFAWHDDASSFDLTTSSDGEFGFIDEVDLIYPPHLHDLHNCFPLAPEKVTITPAMYSTYTREVAEKLNCVKPTSEKLSPNFMPKKNYIVHLRNLQFYMKHGIVVEKVHRVLTFRQSAWMASYIQKNTDMRRTATSKFEKDLFKLLNNAVYGKTMENVRKYVTVKFATTQKQFLKHVKSPYFKRATVFNEHLVACIMHPERTVLNKAIFTGFTVLEFSKLVMYQFHYEYIKPKFGPKAELLLTDTDSLIYLIQVNDLYGNLLEDQHLFDFSDYPQDHPLFSEENKKVIGKFKDETNGKPISKFVGLRSKMYSFVCDGEEKKCARGIKRSVVKREITHDDYDDVLLFETEYTHSMRSIRSYHHRLYSIELTKKSITCFDDKRHILLNGVDTLAYGHYRIQ